MILKFSFVLLLIKFSNLFININGAADCQSAKQSCSQCISISNECFWCGDQRGPNDKRVRCDTEHNLRFDNCPQIIGKITEDPGPRLTLNKEFSNKTDKTIQLRPQKVKIVLRADSEIKVDIHFKRAVDYPMDLYYLMDLSCTMLPHKKILSDIGKKLAGSLEKATKNFKIGFGSFVDKPVMPFSAYKIEPVYCQKEYGEPPYSFSHKQSLTDNSEDFVRQVTESKTSGNVDNPEGTLDALMQVLTCNQEIGWRSQSNKIIVVATDAEFHYAGDGRLAGIITPNDGECHMSENNYTHYNLTDYPSMHQIAEKAQGFNIVFSVSNDVKPVYEKLVEIIGRNAKVASLKSNDDEAIQLIKDIYNNITSSVSLRVKQKPDFVDIKFYSECQTNKRIETDVCEYKEIKEIKFEATIKLKSCPENGSDSYKILIGLPNNNNEVLEIDLKPWCGCNCDKSGELNARHCSSHGTLACGICRECNGKRVGLTCECDPEEKIDPKDPEKHCKSQNSTSICSDRGKCECQKCDCTDTGYQGKFCEIDESSCYPKGDKQRTICNGNGVCINGKCVCSKNFTGPLCDCTPSKESCKNNNDNNGITPANDKTECSNQGTCICNECVCKESTTLGKYCQYCPSCEKFKYCNESRECVPQICEAFYGSKENCTESCSFTYFNLTQDSDNSDSSVRLYRTQCIFQTLDDECGLEFTYERKQTETENILYISKPIKSCKAKLNLVLVSSGVVGGTLLIGLAILLIWKLLTEIWDRKEYARFQKELSKVNWEQSENPLYREAKSTFTNPMFALRERAAKRLSRLTERFSRRFDLNNSVNTSSPPNH